MQLTDEIVFEILSNIEHKQNQERKKREYISEQIYDGNLWFYVKERLKQWYPITYENYSISDYSVLKKVVDKKSKAYKEAPKRKLENDAETNAYEEITKEGDLNVAMKRIDKLYNQHKYTAIGIFKEDDGYDFVPLAPYSFDVVKDNDGNVVCYIISYPDQFVTDGPFKDLYNPLIAETGGQDEGIGKKLYAFWTDTDHKLIRVSTQSNGEKKFENVPIDGNPDNINPYGVLPFVFLPHEIDQNYPNPSPLAGQTVEVNALNSVYLTSGNMQIGQLILKYPADQDIKTVSQGLMTAIKLPQSTNPDSKETTADYISPSPDLAGHRESIMTFLSMILDEQGIQSNQVITGQNEKFSSGFDRLLSSADVQTIIEENQELYHYVECEIYEIIKKIEENYGSMVFKSKDLQITYKKPKVLISDTEKLDNIQKMQELGLLENWEKFQLIDPNLSEDQAKEKAGRIQKEKSVLLQGLNNVQQG
jgi:hypothetical protein